MNADGIRGAVMFISDLLAIHLANGNGFLMTICYVFHTIRLGDRKTHVDFNQTDIWVKYSRGLISLTLLPSQRGPFLWIKTHEKVSPLVQWVGIFGSHLGPGEDGLGR